MNIAERNVPAEAAKRAALAELHVSSNLQMEYMDEKIKVFIQELSECEEIYEIERWQLRVMTYLDEAFGEGDLGRTTLTICY